MEMKKIAVIGAGVVGMTTAYRLSQLGHNVVIIDPELNQSKIPRGCRTASQASLGILMGNTFRRSSGRSWKLRQRSMALWPELIKELATFDKSLKLETPLIQLASDYKEMELMKRLCKERSHLGLKLLNEEMNQCLKPSWPKNQYRGIVSAHDGRVNPLKLLNCLRATLDKLKVKTISAKVISLSRHSHEEKTKWKVILENKKVLIKEFVIICSALGSQSLLKKIGYDKPIEAVLGQALHLTLKKDNSSWKNWPAVLTCNGINLVPLKENQVIVGATLEPGVKPNKVYLKKLLALNGLGPKWLKDASLNNNWYGIRARPLKEPAPILETIETGLILNTAHYRNGILLAPACAEWVGNQIRAKLL